MNYCGRSNGSRKRVAIVAASAAVGQFGAKRFARLLETFHLSRPIENLLMTRNRRLRKKQREALTSLGRNATSASPSLSPKLLNLKSALR